jgi:hypothetical protein
MSNQQETILNIATLVDEQIVLSPEWYGQLKATVDELIVHDFPRLVQILYQLDVPEQKLKVMLQQHPAADAADIITKLMIERQIQKIEFRKQFAGNNQKYTDEERW